MFPIELEIDFEKMDRDPLKTDQLYRHFLREIADRAESLFIQHIPFGETGRTLAALEKGDVERHATHYSVEVGVTPIPEASLNKRPAVT
jgi:hypothetical protein